MFSINIRFATLSVFDFLTTGNWFQIVVCSVNFIQVSSRVSQFWKPTSDLGGASASLPSSRYLNDFEELQPLGIIILHICVCASVSMSLFRYWLNSLWIYGHVCLPESSFRETTFQTFLCLFAIRKGGQRKTLSSQRKIWLGFQESVFPFGCVCFPESGFWENTFQTFMCLFAIKKVGQRKTLSSQRKIWLGFQESVFLENLGGKHFPEVVKNLEMSLFADYIKFDPQTFDYYIYFVFNIYFLISSLKI